MARLQKNDNQYVLSARSTHLSRLALMSGVSALILGAFTPMAFAQDVAEDDEIIVTGIRASLERAMDVKRSSDGVVDAISAEDIGKFPDTNLAESLQRISGVSINRVNGEGSEVTVRGFGGGFNLVTLNGRTMPTANIVTVGGDQSTDFANGSSRSFDFSNLASEGVSGLEVYKTSKADVPSGGLGATINVKTFRPLDRTGFQGTFGAKALHDTGVERGNDITPEVSGLASWTNPSQTVGISLFGSYQRRETSTRSATSNAWNINRGEFFLDPANGLVNANTQVTNPPGPDQLVAYPNDSRYHLAEFERERLNGQAVLQFRPMDNLTLTADATYARNKLLEQRTDQTNWFNRPFGQVTFDGNPVVNTTLFLQETLNGVKDMGFEQQYRGNKDELESFGVNADWGLTDTIRVVVDAHTSSSESGPGAPNGTTSTLVSIGAPVIAAHSVDFSSGFPVQSYTLDDSVREGTNANGILDVGDLGSQIARTIASNQKHDVDEIQIDGIWEMTDNSQLSVGAAYRDTTMTQLQYQTQQTLGDWGITNPGDISEFAPGLVEEYCLSCLFDDYDAGMAEIAFRANAIELNDALSAAYAELGNPVGVTNDSFNQVEEDVTALYAQFNMETSFLSRPARLSAGIRYEDTQVTSTSVVAVPTAIVWTSDQDFQRTVAEGSEVSQDGSYSDVLPNFDFAVDIRDNLVGRVSWGKSIARPGYGSLFFADVANNPPRPTALGGIPSGNSGNPGLLPLRSDNFDVSVEYYYDDASFISAGFFEKRVSNFEGTGQTTRPLFGLRDPASGAPGTRSGQALDALSDIGADATDVNLFTLTALIDQFGLNEGRQMFEDNFSNGSLAQAFVDETFAAYDVTANSDDPLFQFEVTQPINSQDARLYGFEFGFQHFFGESGFGLAGSYTNVNGDISIDVGADPTVDQFALPGLSDTYNITGIYEKNGISARVTYNWRDEFLASTNRGGGNRNPVFNESFGQLDMSVSYEFTDHFLISFEGLNLTEEGTRTFGRDPSNLWFAQELDARYLLGARYKF